MRKCFMEPVKFNSVDELFHRLKPAFQTKLDELKSKNIKFVEIKDLWIFLTRTKWASEHDLELCDMVNDILNIDDVELINYINNKY